MIEPTYQLQTDLPTKSDDCGPASLIPAAQVFDSELYKRPTTRRQRTARVKVARDGTGIAKGPTHIRALKQAHKLLTPRNGYRGPTFGVIDTNDADAWERYVVPHLKRGALILAGINYRPINAYRDGAISGQPGPPRDPASHAFTGNHFVCFHELKEGKPRRVGYIDSLRDGRRELPRGSTYVPLWLARKATLAFHGRGGVCVGVVYPSRAMSEPEPQPPEPPADPCAELREQVADLESELAKMQDENTALQATIAALETEVAELTKRINAAILVLSGAPDE